MCASCPMAPCSDSRCKEAMRAAAPWHASWLSMPTAGSAGPQRDCDRQRTIMPTCSQRSSASPAYAHSHATCEHVCTVCRMHLQLVVPFRTDFKALTSPRIARARQPANTPIDAAENSRLGCKSKTIQALPVLPPSKRARKALPNDSSPSKTVLVRNFWQLFL